MEISFIHTHILVHLHVNKTDFHMKGLALGLALKQMQKATRKSPIKRTPYSSCNFHLPKNPKSNLPRHLKPTEASLTSQHGGISL